MNALFKIHRHVEARVSPFINEPVRACVSFTVRGLRDERSFGRFAGSREMGMGSASSLMGPRSCEWSSLAKISGRWWFLLLISVTVNPRERDRAPARQAAVRPLRKMIAETRFAMLLARACS